MPSGGGKLEWLDLGSGDTYWGATFSPDGRHLAYVSTETGIDEIFVQSWPLGRGKWQVSVDGGQFPVWSRDGKRIFYAKTSAIMAVDVDTSGTVQAGRPRELFRGPYLTRTAPVRNFDVGPGDRFVFVRRRTDVVAPRQLEVVIGW